eukprot:Colp12_sorted_trinity150504_noHs@2466
MDPLSFCMTTPQDGMDLKHRLQAAFDIPKSVKNEPLVNGCTGFAPALTHDALGAAGFNFPLGLDTSLDMFAGPATKALQPAFGDPLLAASLNDDNMLGGMPLFPTLATPMFPTVPGVLPFFSFAPTGDPLELARLSSMLKQSSQPLVPVKQEAPVDPVLLKKQKRRDSHNAVERKRRDNINDRIVELSTLVPRPVGEKPSKGETLRLAAEYIRHLENVRDTLSGKLTQAGLETGNTEFPGLGNPNVVEKKEGGLAAPTGNMVFRGDVPAPAICLGKRKAEETLQQKTKRVSFCTSITDGLEDSPISLSSDEELSDSE